MVRYWTLPKSTVRQTRTRIHRAKACEQANISIPYNSHTLLTTRDGDHFSKSASVDSVDR